MTAKGPKSPGPLMAYFEPPAGLSPEWNKVFHALADQVYVITAFYSHSDVHLLPAESLAAWHDAFRRTRVTAQEVMKYVHGRALRTWNVGHAIDNAIFPIESALIGAILFLTDPLPVQRNGQKINPEELAAPSRARLGELSGFNGKPLLADLAAAVTAECDVRLGLSSVAPPVEVPDAQTVGEQPAIPNKSNRKWMTVDEANR